VALVGARRLVPWAAEQECRVCFPSFFWKNVAGALSYIEVREITEYEVLP
jgi:hypothetical protein